MHRRNVSRLRTLALACGLGFAMPVATRADVLFYNTSTQELDYWLTSNNGNSGTSEYASGTIAAAGYLNGWVPVGSADFTGDGKNDILLQNQNSGGAGVSYWTMNGVTAVNSTSLSTIDTKNFRVVSLVSLRGGRTPDILWQDKTTGDLVYWYLNVSGGAATATSSGPVNYVHTSPGPLASYRAIGAVEFANGSVEVFFQNTSTLQVVYWVLTYTSGVPTLTSSGNVSYTFTDLSNWQADTLDNVGNRILWQSKSTGDLTYWNLNDSSGETTPTVVSSGQYAYPFTPPSLVNYRAVAGTFFYNVVSLTSAPGNTLTVTINGTAPSGGVIVNLSGSPSGITVPASVTIPAGQSSASFSYTFTGPSGSYTVQASCGDKRQTTTLTNGGR